MLLNIYWNRESVLYAFSQNFCQSDLCIFFLQAGEDNWYTQLPRDIFSHTIGYLAFKRC